LAVVAPKSGKDISREPKQSISLQAYPLAQASKIDLQSEAWVGQMKAIIDSCRNLRGEMQISPAQKVPLWISGDKPFLEAAAPYISALAKLSEVKLFPNEAEFNVLAEKEASGAPIALVGAMKLLIKIEVDPQAERVRLSKELTRLANEMNKCKAKLDNQGFVARAPAEVIEQEKKRLIDFELLHAKLEAQMSKLKT
jgi:valyl-tRNA synthetase